MSLEEAARDWSNGTHDLPDDIDATRADEIDALVENVRWRYDQDWWVIVLSVVDWALEADCESYEDKRINAQKKVAKVFTEDLSAIQAMCGDRLFEKGEFQIEPERVPCKWQAMFEQLLQILDAS